MPNYISEEEKDWERKVLGSAARGFQTGGLIIKEVEYTTWLSNLFLVKKNQMVKGGCA